MTRKMKGDRVWVFLPETQRIARATIVMEQRGFDCVVALLDYNRDERVFYKNWSCFKTKKALCEHYYKIFSDSE